MARLFFEKLQNAEWVIGEVETSASSVEPYWSPGLAGPKGNRFKNLNPIKPDPG
jgi:hypothetical protein